MSNVTPFNFDGQPIRVVTDDNGELWFPANEVCEVLGFGNPRDAVARHVDEDDVGKRDTIDNLGRKQLTNHVNESGMYALTFGSTKPEAKRFKKWVTSEVLPSIRRTGGYAAASQPEPPLLRDQIDAGIVLLRAAAEDLKFAPSAVLGGYQKLERRVGVPGLLPAYAVDAPASATGSSEPTKSLAELLKDFGVGVSAQAFNKLLMQRGMLQEQERKSSRGGGVKKFKVCTALEFGKNLTSPSNPRETQPHWYVSKFAELIDLVLPAKPAAV